MSTMMLRDIWWLESEPEARFPPNGYAVLLQCKATAEKSLPSQILYEI
jgi:hypothetical protein